MSNYPVESIQRWLRIIESGGQPIPKILVDGVYDRQTEDAVRIFQGINGLPSTGTVDFDTWNLLRTVSREIEEQSNESSPIYPFEYALKDGKAVKGDRFSLIYIIQVMIDSILVSYNIPPQPITGIYDDQTEQNIGRLQGIWNIPVTGETDKQTWNYLAEAYNVNMNKE